MVVADDENITSILPMPKDIKKGSELSMFLVTTGGTGKKVSAENSKSTAWRKVIAGTNTLTIKPLSVAGALSGKIFTPLSIMPISKQEMSKMMFDMRRISDSKIPRFQIPNSKFLYYANNGLKSPERAEYW